MNGYYYPGLGMAGDEKECFLPQFGCALGNKSGALVDAEMTNCR
jgi:hypothetical protein